MDVVRQAKEAAVKSCNDQKRELESVLEQLDATKQKLASTKQQLQVEEAECGFDDENVWWSLFAPTCMEGASSISFVRSSISLSVHPSVAYIANNTRTQRPSVPNFGKKVPHLWCNSHTSFKVKGQGHQTHNSDTHRALYLLNGKAYELQTWYMDGGRRPTSATGAVTYKVKVARSRDQSELTWPNAVPVSLEASGGIPCRLNPAATLLVTNSTSRTAKLYATTVYWYFIWDTAVLMPNHYSGNYTGYQYAREICSKWLSWPVRHTQPTHPHTSASTFIDAPQLTPHVRHHSHCLPFRTRQLCLHTELLTTQHRQHGTVFLQTF